MPAGSIPPIRGQVRVSAPTGDVQAPRQGTRGGVRQLGLTLALALALSLSLSQILTPNINLALSLALALALAL